MPAGDLITGDYQVELNALLLGATTGYHIDVAGMAGLGVPQTKTADSSYDGQDGSAAAPDFLDVRVVTIPIVIDGDGDSAAVMTGLAGLITAWQPARDGVDVELHFQLPGFGHLYLIGRARGVTDDLAQIKTGIARALCRFDAIDPNFHTP